MIFGLASVFALARAVNIRVRFDWRLGAVAVGTVVGICGGVVGTSASSALSASSAVLPIVSSDGRSRQGSWRDSGWGAPWCPVVQEASKPLAPKTASSALGTPHFVDKEVPGVCEEFWKLLFPGGLQINPRYSRQAAEYEKLVLLEHPRL